MDTNWKKSLLLTLNQWAACYLDIIQDNG